MIIDSDETPVTTTEDSSSSDGSEKIEVEEVPVPELALLNELIHSLEDYTPTVPDALTAKYLNSAGFDEVDPRIVRLISVAAQKFIADITNDSLQHCKTRTTNTQHAASHHGSNKDKKNAKDRKYTLSMEDLTPALTDHGITMRKPQYFV